MFDDCIAEHIISTTSTNNGEFDQSELNCWLQDVILSSFPEELRSRIAEVSLPSYGMMFGHDDWYEKVIEPDNDEQLPLMKKHINRVADFNDDYKWYWLKNAIKSSYTSLSFATVAGNGCASCLLASSAAGVLRSSL